MIAVRGTARSACLLVAGLLIGGCAAAGDPSSERVRSGAAFARPPAVPTPIIEARAVREWSSGAMVAAAHPLAVDAGIDVLRAGGSALDAAIAVQAVLGLVEPQSSGIGGGAFLMHYESATGDLVTYDGREVAPQGATAEMFLDAEGKPLRFIEAVRSGRAVGVPGLIAMLELAHGEHGRLPWDRPWQRAIELGEQGFSVTPRLNEMIRAAQSRGGLLPEAAAYLTLDGTTPLPVGHRLVNERYAASLRRIAREGARGFYEGPIAEEIVAAAARAPLPGSLTLADLRAYRPNRLEPICGAYRVYLVCGMRPPSSGGIAILGVLGILENFQLSGGPVDPLDWHRFIEAQRLAYADRDAYVADDRFEAVPLAGLIDRDYLRSRAALIGSAQAMASAEPGLPPGATPRGRDATGGTTGTSHFVVVDARGNVVSMTTTVESFFGSQRMAGGFFLNNQLTDFSFLPRDASGRAIANAVAPGKKPRSSMAPTVVFRDGMFELAVGSPGGNAIIAYVSKAIVGMLDWGLSPQQAVELPNVIARGAVVVETSRADPALVSALRERGHRFAEARGTAEGSGLHAVRRLSDGRLVGAADPRREGKVVPIP